MGYGEPGATRLDYARRLSAPSPISPPSRATPRGSTAGRSDLKRKPRPGAARAPPRRHPRPDRGTPGRRRDGLIKAIHEAAEKIRQRALVVIVSDLLFPPEPLREAFQHLRFRKHDVSVFHLLDRQEIDFKFDRPTRFLDLEGGPSLLADPTLIQRR